MNLIPRDLPQKMIVFCVLLFVTMFAYSQEENKKLPESQIFKLKVSVGYRLTEGDVRLLKQELKTSKKIERLVKIDFLKGTIYFETKNKAPYSYVPIFNKYFSTYDVYEYGDIICSVNNNKAFPEHYPSRTHLNDSKKEELLFQKDLDSWKRNYPLEWEEFQKESLNKSNDLK